MGKKVFKDLLKAAEEALPSGWVEGGYGPDYVMSANGEFEPQPLSARAARFEASRVPLELTGPEPLVPTAPTYDDLVDLLQRVAEEPMYRPEPVHPDVFESLRWEDETRAEAKGRTFMELYGMQAVGYPVKPEHMWSVRAMYQRVYQFVQLDGRPYSTHNPLHFANRYGMMPAAVHMVGLRKDTVMECARLAERTRVSLFAIRVLSV